MTVSGSERHVEPEGEDWHNVSDLKTRRKLQNRQNQRARRLRNVYRDDGPLVKQYVPGRKAGKFVYLTRSDTEKEQTVGERHDSEHTQMIPLVLTLAICDTDEILQNMTGEDEKQTRIAMKAIGPSLLKFGSMGGVNLCKYRASDYWQRGYYLHSDQLLTLLYYNVFRAFSWNVQMLGLDFLQMSKEDYASPFLSTNNSDTCLFAKLPKYLRPTEVQRKVYHHAGYDTFPCPVIRNNMIQHKMMSEEEEDEVCLDMEGLNKSSYGIGTDPGPYSNLDEGNRSGITIWGDPWNLENWEISEYIALKHPWLVSGAIEAQTFTNVRRRARGWKELHFA